MILKSCFTFFFVLISIPLFAQELSLAQSENNRAPEKGQVILEKAPDYSYSYLKRRVTHAALFSVIYEKFYPLDYRSQFNDGHIEDIIGEDRVDLVGVEIGYKYNFSLGSLAALGTYAAGAIDGSLNGSERNLAFTKYGISLNYALDALLEEPWLVPYVQAGAHQFVVAESDITGDLEATSSIAANYRIGLLFQLDWFENYMDDSARAERLSSSALENTFLDIYATEYLASSNAIDPASQLGTEGDPNLHSSLEFGVGLKLEF
jgi:hypothetical protein